jgi:hypothetical protein
MLLMVKSSLIMLLSQSKKGKNSWMAVVTGYDPYGSLDPHIWKESVHLIAKHLGVKNRSNVVVKEKSTAEKSTTEKSTKEKSASTHKPSPSKIYASKMIMTNDGEHVDDVS